MVCMKCGKEIAEASAFCPLCGAKQVMTYKEVFVRGNLPEKEFIGNINKWFQWHPKAANVKCTFGIDSSLGLLANGYKLNQFVIEYELFENDNQNQYGLVKEEKYTLVQKDRKEFIGEWQRNHPNTKIVNWAGGTHSRGQSASLVMGGFGARNRLNIYIFYKFPRG